MNHPNLTVSKLMDKTIGYACLHIYLPHMCQVPKSHGASQKGSLSLINIA